MRWTALASLCALSEGIKCSRQEVHAPHSLEDRILDKSLVRSATLVASFADGDSSRYFSVLEVKSNSPLSFGDPEACGKREVWLAGKVGEWPHSTIAEVVAHVGCDARLRKCGTEASCVSHSPVLVEPNASYAHNMALTVSNGTLYGLGGVTAGRASSPKHRRVAPTSFTEVLQATGLTRLAEREGPRLGLAAVRSNGGIGPKTPGCVENRPMYRPDCQYDGRFSIAVTKERVLAYARANTHHVGGGRYVSVAQAERSSFTKARAQGAPPQWSAFELVQFSAVPPRMYRNGTRPRESAFSGFSDRATANEYGNIYTSAVKPNPYDRETFLGLFSASITKTTHRGLPLHERQEEAAIFLAVSCDGVHFSPPAPLVAGLSTGNGEMNDHVVDGLVASFATDELYFYVHHGVPGTFWQHCDYRADNGTHGIPSSIARYTLDRGELRAYTRAMTAQLRLQGTCKPHHAHKLDRGK